MVFGGARMRRGSDGRVKRNTKHCAFLKDGLMGNIKALRHELDLVLERSIYIASNAS